MSSSWVFVCWEKPCDGLEIGADIEAILDHARCHGFDVRRFPARGPHSLHRWLNDTITVEPIEDGVTPTGYTGKRETATV